MDTLMDRVTWQNFLWLVFTLVTYGNAGNVPVAETWSRWWSYDGISGPNYWGKTNPEWKLCKHGRQQSPINIEPTRLLFDPNLKHLKIDSSVKSKNSSALCTWGRVCWDGFDVKHDEHS
ncbi:Carbonic anhydrase 1 [Bulinus truncatus]|nr:Carbonic anhydrase 1 [Bulinus truncatus]